MGAKQTRIANILSGDTEQNQGGHMKISELELDGNVIETPPKPVDNLRKRIFRGFTYNLNDPRSPNMQLNRTPLVFEDGNDKTLNLDDTFADLFVANYNQPIEFSSKPNNPKIDQKLKENEQLKPHSCEELQDSLSSPDSDSKSRSVEFTSLYDEETMPLDVILQQTPLLLQQPTDPRSPTIGLTRTPIIFKDDDDEEDAMLEDILATLSLDLSSPKSFSASSPIPTDVKKPINKHLDKARSVKKPEKPIRKNKHFIQKQRIYLDCENVSLTPKRKVNKIDDANKRTPLSCMKNRVHLRSKSVESTKEPKTRLSLTSYDDVLNPVQNLKVVNLHTLADDQFDNLY